MVREIVEQLKKQIAEFQTEVRAEESGRVGEVGDGIVRIWGLAGARSQEMLEIETANGIVRATALNLEEDTIGAVLLGEDIAVREGDTVRATGSVLSIPVGRELLGRVVNPLMEPLDDKGPVFAEGTLAKQWPMERTAPGVIERESVGVPLHTGIKAVDAMIPIGRGQRELIIGDRQTGKTAIAIDTILNQQQDGAYRTPMCIYVAIGLRESKIRKIVAELEARGALPYTVIVSAPASAPAPLQFISPYAGCAIGEYFMEQGEDALVVYDDLSKHAQSYRQISLLLRRPPGREAYPGDIFYLHSRLLERAARLSQERGGGSLTALPIIETQLGDVAAYIPTNVISITDGQIYLEPDLFYQGVRPAINVGLSVSRVGSAAQTRAMKQVAGRLRLDLAQFRELAAFVQFASDLDEGTRRRIERGGRMTELLKQDDFSPMVFEEQVVVLYAGVNGYFDLCKPAEVRPRAAAFISFMRKSRSGLLDGIKTEKAISSEREDELKEALAVFEKLKQ
ncbi:MAG: F0F1 ATP synthase subunit alpha [Parcubacteria group bacterium]|nr:F0F1 ATP synthase subunit alpha [Parcubacteria group bacterium]